MYSHTVSSHTLNTTTKSVRPHVSCIQQTGPLPWRAVDITSKSLWCLTVLLEQTIEISKLRRKQHVWYGVKNDEGTGDPREGSKQLTSAPTIQSRLLDSGKQIISVRILKRTKQWSTQTRHRNRVKHRKKKCCAQQCGGGWDRYVGTAPSSCSGLISGPSARHGIKQTGE